MSQKTSKQDGTCSSDCQDQKSSGRVRPSTGAIPKLTRIPSGAERLRSAMQAVPPTGTPSRIAQLSRPSTIGSFISSQRTPLDQQQHHSAIPKHSSYRTHGGKHDATALDSKTSLEEQVEQELLYKSSTSQGGKARAHGSSKVTVDPPVITVSNGPVKGTKQISVKQTVNRLGDTEHISKLTTGIKVEKCGVCTEKYELNVQQMEPTGASSSGRGGHGGHMDPIHEVLSTTSSITIAPGVTEMTKSTVHETTKPSKPSRGGSRADELKKLVESENKDVSRIRYMQPPDLLGGSPSDYILKKRLQKMSLNQESVKRLESLIINPSPRPDEAFEDIAPELMAAIMHTEERGMTMGSAPESIYNILFPDLRDPVIKISPVAQSPLEKVVVPVNIPQNFHSDALTPELTSAIESVLPPEEPQPSDDIYLRFVLKKGNLPKAQNIAVKKEVKKKKKREDSLLSDEQPPWDSDELNPVMSVVGVSPSNVMTAVSPKEVETLYQMDRDRNVEYQVIPEPPRHISKIQLRGSQKPVWFPGYYVALPDSIKLARSPSEVLSAAWHAVQPTVFPDESFMVVGN